MDFPIHFRPKEFIGISVKFLTFFGVSDSFFSTRTKQKRKKKQNKTKQKTKQKTKTKTKTKTKKEKEKKKNTKQKNKQNKNKKKILYGLWLVFILKSSYDLTMKSIKGVLHPTLVFGLFLHFSQKLQHIGNK